MHRKRAALVVAVAAVTTTVLAACGKRRFERHAGGRKPQAVPNVRHTAR